MSSENLELLEGAISKDLRDLDKMPANSDNRGNMVKEIDTFYKLKIEEIKTAGEIDQKDDELKGEATLKQDQLKEQRIDRYVKMGVDIGAIVLPLAFYAVWMGIGFKFEETGTFTSNVFRNLYSRFKPTK